MGVIYLLNDYHGAKVKNSHPHGIFISISWGWDRWSLGVNLLLIDCMLGMIVTQWLLLSMDNSSICNKTQMRWMAFFDRITIEQRKCIFLFRSLGTCYFPWIIVLFVWVEHALLFNNHKSFDFYLHFQVEVRYKSHKNHT